MDRKSLAFSAVLVGSITVSCTLTTAPQSAALQDGRENAPTSSQQPSPRGGKGESAPPREQTKPDQPKPEDVRGTPGSPDVVRVLPISKNQEQTAQEQAESKERTTTNRWTVGLTGALVAGTLGLIFVGWLQWRTYRDTLATNKQIERAYVKISHEQQNGSPLRFVVSEGNPIRVEAWFTIQVKNWGQTPADVLGGGAWIVTSPSEIRVSPEPPPHFPVDITPAFLVGSGGSDFFREKSFIWITPETHANLIGDTPTEHLWLVALVDYRDRFGNLHRAGYGRHYNRSDGDLVFDWTTAALNYDEPLPPEEAKKYEKSQKRHKARP